MTVKEYVIVVKYDLGQEDDLGGVLNMLVARVYGVDEEGRGDPKVRDATGRLSGPGG